MKPKVILYIGNQLSKHGKSPTNIETLGKLLEEEGFQIIYSSSKKHTITRLIDMILTTILSISKVDYVLIDTYSTSAFWYSFFCSQIARIFNKKYIPILHGGNLPERLKNNPILCKMIFKNAYKNVAPSGYLKHHFEETGLKNVIFIPNNIEIKKYNYKERKIFNPNILWVRSFASIYNPNMALYVFQKIKENYPHATLTMVGPEKDGSLEVAKKLALKLNLSVHFTGKLSKKEWTTLAADHDIFINTTHFDNTPVSIIEAMALGLAVVSTNVGGIPFLLKHQENALLVKDNDVKAMYDSVLFFVKYKEESQNISKNAYLFIQNFDWNIVKKQWELLLR